MTGVRWTPEDLAAYQARRTCSEGSGGATTGAPANLVRPSPEGSDKTSGQKSRAKARAEADQLGVETWIPRSGKLDDAGVKRPSGPACCNVERVSRGHGPDHGGGTPPPIRRDSRRDDTLFKETENQIQIATAEFLDVALPDDARWFHVPNGELRDPAIAGRLKAMGLKPGAPDVLVLWRLTFIWIELKTATGVLSRDQKAWRDWLIASGASWFLCRSVLDVEAALRSCGMDLKARVR